MTTEYAVEGMTCQGCVAKVKNGLEGVSGVETVEVSLVPPIAKIKSEQKINSNILQQAVPDYPIAELNQVNTPPTETDVPPVSLSTYRPLILIVTFIAGVCALVQFPFDDFAWMEWMRNFMAGFFIVFAFFKLLNLDGFAKSYAMYDIIAGKWRSWGFVYPFVELTLGILYLINVVPVITNVLTIVILGVSSIGVIQSNLNKKKIKCACLGDVFNLPMSTVTIVEDLAMVGMAIIMLFVK